MAVVGILQQVFGVDLGAATTDMPFLTTSTVLIILAALYLAFIILTIRLFSLKNTSSK